MLLLLFLTSPTSLSLVTTRRQPSKKQKEKRRKTITCYCYRFWHPQHPRALWQHGGNHLKKQEQHKKQFKNTITHPWNPPLINLDSFEPILHTLGPSNSHVINLGPFEPIFDQFAPIWTLSISSCVWLVVKDCIKASKVNLNKPSGLRV